jgi:ubiquinone/menaquinone biosynthesis C-methylase UbiE
MDNRSRNTRRSLYDFAPMAAGYESWYNTPAGRAHDGEQKDLVRRFLPRVEQGARLLDVGCGTGHWSRFFAGLGFEVVGIDVSLEMIAVARSAVEDGCRFVVADAHKLPFADPAFDLVTAMVVLEFVGDAERVLAEMARCARSPGHLVVGALNETSPLNRDRIAEGKEPYRSGRMFTASELGRLLSRFGPVRIGLTPEQAEGSGSPSPAELPAGSWDTAGQGTFIVAEVRV